METQIIELLSNYGTLGIWTLSLLYERYISGKKTQAVIENNTIAMTKVYEVIQSCPKQRLKGG